MSRIFLTVLHMSLTAGFCTAAVIVIRFFLKRQPKIFSYLLWGVVLFRLLCPFSISSSYSLLRVNADLFSGSIMRVWDMENIGEMQETVGGADIQETGQADSLSPLTADAEKAADIWQNIIAVGAWIWLAGIFTLALYSIGTILRLRRLLAGAVCVGKDQYAAEGIATPFVWGICRPRIYLPMHLREEERPYVLTHEKIHIERKDYLVKMAFYAAACLHWFNPFAWLSFVLMENDMEMSCDEAVLKKLGPGVKTEYSRSLLALSTGETRLWSSPLAFGEGGVKGRVRNVLAYRKRTAFAVVLVSAVVIAAGAGLLLNPAQGNGKDEQSEDVQKLKAFVEDYAQAFCDRTGEAVAGLYVDEETALENVPTLEKDGDQYLLGLSSPWPYGFRYQVYPEENRADIYYFAWTSDPHITVWLEKIQCIVIDGEYRAAEDLYYTFNNIASKEEFDSAYRMQEGYWFVDYRENGFVDAINYQREEGTSTVDNTVYTEPVRAAEHILNLTGGIGTAEGESGYQAMVRYTFADGSEVTIPMYQANYDAETGESTGEPVWIVDTAVWNAGAP